MRRCPWRSRSDPATASGRRDVRPRGGHTRGEITAQPQFDTEVPNHFVSCRGVPSPETFDRKQIDHARKLRDLRQLLGRWETPQQRILDELGGGSGVGRRSTEAGRWSAVVETPHRTASFPNRDHAPSRFGLQHSATLDATATTDLGEVLTEGRHASNVSGLRC